MEVTEKRSRLSSKPHPRGEKRRATERDRIWLNLLHDHGALPTSILTPFTAHLYTPQSERKDVFRADRRNHDESTKRLKRLFHEGGLLVKPSEQFDTANAERHYTIYDLSNDGRLLTENSEYSPRLNPKLIKHDVMSHTITASIKFALRDTGIKYIPQHTILAMKAKTLVIKDVLGHDLVPDGIFGLEYSNSKKRYFCLEADRGTEPQESKNPKRKDIRRNYLQYREFIGGGRYKDHFGFDDGLCVLNVTNSVLRMENMIDVARRASKTGKSTFSLYHFTSDLGTDYFCTPHNPLVYLASDPWHRAGHESFDIAKP